MGERVYEVSKLEIPCVLAYAVYAGYDGHAPDTKDLVACASGELAERVCELLRQFGPDNGAQLQWLKDSWQGFSLPHVEGCQSFRSWAVRLTYVPVGAKRPVAKSVTEALVILGGEKVQ